MNIRRLACLALAIPFAFLGCGDDDSDSDGGSSGSSGTLGRSGSGNAGRSGSGNTAGSPGGGGSSNIGGSSNGGTSSGGRSNNGGSSSAECPTEAPNDGDECSASGVCAYDNSICQCFGDEWNCQEQDEDCPAAAPTDGDACADLAGTRCLYETGLCRCTTAEEWSCPTFGGGGSGGGFNFGGGGGFAQVDCSGAQPEDGAACTGIGFCEEFSCACFNSEWNCF